MLKKTAMILTILATSTLSTAAMAGGGHGGHGHGHWGGKGHWGHHGWGHGRHFYLRIDAPRYGYGCYRFKKRYLRTGKRYWLRKYRICRTDY